MNKFKKIFAINFLSFSGWMNLLIWFHLFLNIQEEKLLLVKDPSAINVISLQMLTGVLVFLLFIFLFVIFLAIELAFKNACKWAFKFPIKNSIFYNIFFYIGIILNFIIFYYILPFKQHL